MLLLLLLCAAGVAPRGVPDGGRMIRPRNETMQALAFDAAFAARLLASHRFIFVVGSPRSGWCHVDSNKNILRG